MYRLSLISITPGQPHASVDYQWLFSRFLCIKYLLISLIDFHHRHFFAIYLCTLGDFWQILFHTKFYHIHVDFRPEDERCISFPFVDWSHWFSLPLSFAIYAHWEISKDFGLFEILMYLQPTYITPEVIQNLILQAKYDWNKIFQCDCTQIKATHDQANTFFSNSKGKLISKGLFGFFNSPKKRTKKFCPSRLG